MQFTLRCKVCQGVFGPKSFSDMQRPKIRAVSSQLDIVGKIVLFFVYTLPPWYGYIEREHSYDDYRCQTFCRRTDIYNARTARVQRRPFPGRNDLCLLCNAD